MNIHHVGYLVEDIQEGIQEFSALGYTPDDEGAVRDEVRGIWICFMQNGPSCVELITPLSAQSTVSGMLKKKGAGPYHICYLSHDLQKDTEILSEKGYMVIQPPAPAVALQSRNVVFLYKKSAGMIELLEE